MCLKRRATSIIPPGAQIPSYYRSQFFRVGDCDTIPFPVNCSVPQGSCLGPVKFISYIEDVVDLMERHRVNHHLFADDKQLYLSTSVTDVPATLRRLSDCVTDVISWFSSCRLQLNVSKTELMWIGTRQRLHQLHGAETTLMVGTSSNQCTLSETLESTLMTNSR